MQLALLHKKRERVSGGGKEIELKVPIWQEWTV